MINKTVREVTAIETIETKTCDRCNKGEMIRTGIVLLSYPEKYEHKCNNCGMTEAYNSTYPRKFLEKK